MPLSLEDTFRDVLSKAARGLNKSPAQLSETTGFSLEQIRAVLDGKFDEDVVRALAAPLGLASDRVVALGRETYVPSPVKIEGLLQFNTPFSDYTVNAYLVWDSISKSASIFDTGSDADEIMDAAVKLGVRIEQVFITHSHGDHIYDLDRILEKTHAQAWAPKHEEVIGAQTFNAGKEFQIGSLKVVTRLTYGHSRGGVTYIVHGLAQLVAICGDALFAGSMGGGLVSYTEALRTNREAIFSLSDETILAPGHGPMTTVGEQRIANPFFHSI